MTVKIELDEVDGAVILSVSEYNNLLRSITNAHRDRKQAVEAKQAMVTLIIARLQKIVEVPYSWTRETELNSYLSELKSIYPQPPEEKSPETTT